jgi:hypothetical protein
MIMAQIKASLQGTAATLCTCIVQSLDNNCNIIRYVWPWAKGISIGHDSYLCKRYKYTQAFPTQRKKGANNFVASVVEENHTLWLECPWECRPDIHKDWKYC